ncbi:hypothetical protein CLV90_0543 [Maribacter spongiicola]|uniref:Lipoprotein n=1 Tax=Maribacter spongiicola TaxID=1206753 RepID=A0A4R7K7C7_9FLAO|nr:hypothetical protein [Maribacter spongiicola]TDT46492.1 hypothetical protein CLV90_0543 [Maribacter spongiicola]
MPKFKVIIISFLFIISCNCQKKLKKGAGQVEAKIESDYISSVLEDKNFNTLLNTNMIIAYDIKQQLIEGTKDEYSNKLFLSDTLSQSKRNKLLIRLKSDASYDWNSLPKDKNFEPKKQYLLKSDTGRLTLLIDSNFERIGFINLEGQKIVHLTREMSEFMKKL